MPKPPHKRNKTVLTRAERRRRPSGRPPVGKVLRCKAPPWIHEQLRALHAGTPAKCSQGECMRDILKAGLLTLGQSLPDIEGFHPGRALIEARARGEPE